METIKPLPESVRNSVRSGVILFDLARVVEELIYNSLDAGASKVSVFIGVGTGFVKVVDDGSGITRDGLVLLGERYATSKYHHTYDMDASRRSFGFRGEALASISDISLLEIITKFQGRPNGFRKVLKGCKCMYLGVNDDRKDVGTTVVVRDLFYNQPVRRKHLQSSPKKVLQSVKKCVFRIALVNSHVSYKVFDNESEDELLCTHSSSTLALLMNGFGNVVSTLHEVNVDDDFFKLSGYLSGPSCSFPTKVFQYVYINSRFVCKGPINKLLNQLATRFGCLDSLEADIGPKSRKRKWSKSYPAYLLNIFCPRSFYDLTFESSKTLVEFKDWVAILAFIEQAVKVFWNRNCSYGESSSDLNDVKEGQMQVERDIKSPDSDSLDTILSDKSQNVVQSCRMVNHIFSQKHHCSSSRVQTIEEYMFHGVPDTVVFKDRLFKTDIQNDHSFQSKDSQCSIFNQEYFTWLPDANIMIQEKAALNTGLTVEERWGNKVENFLYSGRESDSLKIELDNDNESADYTLSTDFEEYSNNVKVLGKPFLKSCSSQESFSRERNLLPNVGSEFHADVFKTNQLQSVQGRDDVLDFDRNNQTFSSCPQKLWQSERSYSRYIIPRLTAGDDISTDIGFLSNEVTRTESCRENFDEKYNPSFEAIQMKNCGSNYDTLSSECCSAASGSLFGSTFCGVQPFIDKSSFERSRIYDNEVLSMNLWGDEELDCKFVSDNFKESLRREDCTSSCIKQRFNVYDLYEIDKEFRKFDEKSDVPNSSPPIHPDMSTNERRCFWLDLCNPLDTYECGKQKFQHLHRERRWKRSQSAPPFYNVKRKSLLLEHILEAKDGKCDSQIFSDLPACKVNDLKHCLQPVSASHLCFGPDSLEKLMLDTRLKMRPLKDMNENCGGEILEMSRVIGIQDVAPSKVLNLMYASEPFSKESQDPIIIKWRNSSRQSSDKCPPVDNENKVILDISTGILHLAGDSLFLDSIEKNFLEKAKNLQQVDKKFIPVVSGNILAVIDQHAADERIRLEELHEKILSGEAKRVTYLDAEQELVLPELGHQLLHNYAEHIKEWGWICNIHSKDSKSFKRNLSILRKHATTVTLIAVPCILGVNLSDLDLLEFLQQLADTDGSSTIPPSVFRVLNSKACRGAIMFGDSLLPSECSLIVQELKQTKLSFQCAHGRPTMVPLVNLEALHRQIAKLGMLNDDSNNSWHGLSRHEFSLQRTADRLRSAIC